VLSVAVVAAPSSVPGLVVPGSSGAMHAMPAASSMHEMH
jgi:hypothetical protein